MPEDREEQPVIGRTSATDKSPSYSDSFSFWLGENVIVNPFDIVEVDQVKHGGGKSTTWGLVTILDHWTDSPNHLANYISSNFGELSEVPNTPRQGTTVAHVNVLSNDADIYMPVLSDRLVRFATPEGVEKALGIRDMAKKDRVPAGLIKMSNGTNCVAYIDRRYVLGPLSAHVNISGISGLATKTSYAMFLIQSILQSASEEDRAKIAVILLNVKQANLLQIDQEPDRKPTTEDMELWGALGLRPGKFEKVHYFLPRGDKGVANTFLPSVTGTVYAYDFQGAADKLDLLFADVPDTYSTLESILSEIREGVLSGDREFENIHSWDNLLNSPPIYDPNRKGDWRNIKASSLGVFRRHMRRMVKTLTSGVFVNSLSTTEKNLGRELARTLEGGHVYVVDIAKLRDHEQMLVFGDLLRSVYNLKSDEPPKERKGRPVPDKVIIFVDELNKYAPAGPRPSPLTERVIDIAERGRSLGVTLISCQQFASQAHERVVGNCATRVVGRTASSEVAHKTYNFLGEDIRNNVGRLISGELIMSHPVYRQPVKIIFPRPTYKVQEF
ncbi:MAG: ATP-binding protein [candidate division WOR-3 bacterium]